MSNKLKFIMHFFTANFLEFLSWFFRLKRERIVFSSTNLDSYNFNSKYLFQCFLSCDDVFFKEIYFVVNDKTKLKNLENKYGKHFINTNKFNGALKAAFAKTWVCSALETPNFIFYALKNKKRIIYHLGHGVPLKRIGLDEQTMSWLQYINRFLRTRLFTHVVCFSEKFKPVMQRVFNNPKIEYLELGQPRNDVLGVFDKNEILDKILKVYPKVDIKARFVLYAPTWRSYAETRFFPFSIDFQKLNDLLVRENIYLLLRGHPFFPFLLSETAQGHSNILSFNADYFTEIMDYLPIFDKLITDYSSIYLDFLCLDRPMGFLPYDFDEYDRHTGFSVSYTDFTPGLHIANETDLLSFLTDSGASFSVQRKNLSAVINAKAYGNSEENYRCLLRLISDN